jgi:hypothetical protein
MKDTQQSSKKYKNILNLMSERFLNRKFLITSHKFIIVFEHKGNLCKHYKEIIFESI